MRARSRGLIAALCLALAAPLAQAEGLPDLGDPGQADLSPQMERKIGESLLRSMRWHDPDYLDDAEVEDYLNTLGNRLAAASEARSDFQFFAVKDASLNAYAWPGGVIGVHTGLILAAESESELAAVLAHEVSHVTQRHIVRIFAGSQQTTAVALAGLLIAALAARGNGAVTEAAIATTQAVGIQRQLNFTREFEREADRLGLQTLSAAGFDVRGMPDFFERLQKHNRLQEGNAPAYLRTHPLTTERIADMQNRVVSMRYKQLTDSLEFTLVRAKLRAARGTAGDAVADFLSLLNEKRGPEAAARYGLARAYLRQGQTALAEAEIARLRALRVVSPMVESLAAEVRLAAQDKAGALAFYQAASRYPASRTLRDGRITTLLEMGQAAQAAALAEEALKNERGDATLYALAARAWGLMGKRTQQHRYTAESYALKGQLLEAIEQLELARRAKDGDFFEQSVVDARLRELKKQRQDELAEKKQR